MHPGAFQVLAKVLFAFGAAAWPLLLDDPLFF
jgi:hypothetical protein